MNLSSIIHGIIALVISVFVLALHYYGVDATLLLSLSGALLFLGREHAHAEIKLYKKATYTNSFKALAFWKWDVDTFLDVWWPVVFCATLYFFL